MKHLFRILTAVAVFGTAGFVAQAQPTPKIFVIDMAKIFDSHYKTEEHRNKLKADEGRANTMLEKLVKEGTTMANDYQALLEKIKSDPMASKEAKAKAEGDAQGKLEEIEKKRQEIQNLQQTVRNELGQRMQNFREVLIEEISKVAIEIVKKRGGNILVDKSGPSAYGVPNFLYVDSGFEITDEVMKEVNKDRPATTPAPAAPAATAPAPATKAPAANEGPAVSFPKK